MLKWYDWPFYVLLCVGGAGGGGRWGEPKKSWSLTLPSKPVVPEPKAKPAAAWKLATQNASQSYVMRDNSRDGDPPPPPTHTASHSHRNHHFNNTNNYSFLTATPPQLSLSYFPPSFSIFLSVALFLSYFSLWKETKDEAKIGNKTISMEAMQKCSEWLEQSCPSEQSWLPVQSPTGIQLRPSAGLTNQICLFFSAPGTKLRACPNLWNKAASATGTFFQ